MLENNCYCFILRTREKKIETDLGPLSGRENQVKGPGLLGYEMSH